MMRRLPLLFVSLLAAALFTGCAGLTDNAAATVYGEPISEEAVEAELEVFRASDRYQQLADSGDIEQVERDFLQGTLAQLVRRAVLTPIADEHGVEVTDADVDAEMELIKADFPDDTTFQEALKEQALTETKLRELVGDRLLEDAIRAEAVLVAETTDEEVQAYYDENLAQFQQTCAQHILVEGAAEARVIAADLQRTSPGKLDDAFAELAAKHSQDTTNAEQGGELGCNPGGQFVEEFETALNDLEIDEISDPVQTQFGFHVIRVTERTTAPLEQVEQQIQQQLSGPRQDEAWTEFIENAYAEAEVEVNSRYGVLDVATGQILDPSATDVPGGQAPRPDAPEEPLGVPGPGEAPPPSP